jgi:hypothetical protein
MPLSITNHPAVRVTLALFKMVFAAAALSLLLSSLGSWIAGAEGGYWGWIAGAATGLVIGPFGRMNVGGFKIGTYRQDTNETPDADRKTHQISSAPVAALIGFLVGGFAFLPISGLAMLIWFSVAQSPWGPSAEVGISGAGANFKSSDLSLLVTATAPVLVGAIAGTAFCLFLFFVQQKGKRPD